MSYEDIDCPNPFEDEEEESDDEWLEGSDG